MIVETIFGYVAQRAFVYQSIASLGVYLAIRLVGHFRIRRRRFKLIRYYGYRGPEMSIWHGVMFDLRRKPARFEVEERWLDNYGPTYAYCVGDLAHIVSIDLDLLKDVFLDKQECFTERVLRDIKSLLSESVLFAPHNRWRYMRKVMAPAFSRYALKDDASRQYIYETIKLMVDYIEMRLGATNVNKTTNGQESSRKMVKIDVHELMKSTTLRIISDMAVNLKGVAVKEDEPTVAMLDAFLQRSSSKLIQLVVMFPFLLGALQVLINFATNKLTMGPIHESLEKTVDQKLSQLRERLREKQHLARNQVSIKARHLKQEAHQQFSMMDTLVGLHYDNKLTRNEVFGNAHALLFAGYETSSTTLTYLMWVLAKHVHVQDRLREELKAHGTQSEYLDQVINETMRLYPTVINFTVRQATRNCRVAKDRYVVPKGAIVMYNAWLINRSPQIWPQPEVFDPSRFEAHKMATMHPCAFAPFGMGERKCLGIQLAMIEIKTLVCDVLLRYRLHLESPMELVLVTAAVLLSKPRDRVMILFEKL